MSKHKKKPAGDPARIKLGLALPCTDAFMPTPFVDSFICQSRPGFVYLRPTSHGPIYTVRNELVDQALSQGLEYILWMDTDQIYPADSFYQLINHRKDVVVGKTHRRYPPYDPILLRGKMGSWESVPVEEWGKGGLVEVDSTGFGCVLIKTKVFEALERPYFDLVYTEEGKPIGEDFYFWAKVKAAGFRIFVDCSLKIGHLKYTVINEQSYHAYQVSKPQEQVA